MNFLPNELQDSYDRVAADYAAHFRDEMKKKPFDRKMLEWFIEKVGAARMICDLGCGPGIVAGYLAAKGANACGIDLSAKMVDAARREFPDISFEQGDMLNLEKIKDSSFGGVAAFYSIIHVPHELVVTALREIRRVLMSNGVLLLTFHIGSETRHFDRWFDQNVNLDFRFFEREEMKIYLIEAGFAIEEVIERDSYPEVEVQTRRAYVFARKNEA